MKAIFVISGLNFQGNPQTFRAITDTKGAPSAAFPAIAKTLALQAEAIEKTKAAGKEIGWISDVFFGFFVQANTTNGEAHVDLQEAFDMPFIPAHYGMDADIEWVYRVDMAEKSVSLYGGGNPNHLPVLLLTDKPASATDYLSEFKDEFRKAATAKIADAIAEIEKFGFKVELSAPVLKEVVEAAPVPEAAIGFGSVGKAPVEILAKFEDAGRSMVKIRHLNGTTRVVIDGLVREGQEHFDAAKKSIEENEAKKKEIQQKIAEKRAQREAAKAQKQATKPKKEEKKAAEKPKEEEKEEKPESPELIERLKKNRLQWLNGKLVLVTRAVLVNERKLYEVRHLDDGKIESVPAMVLKNADDLHVICNPNTKDVFVGMIIGADPEDNMFKILQPGGAKGWIDIKDVQIL